MSDKPMTDDDSILADCNRIFFEYLIGRAFADITRNHDPDRFAYWEQQLEKNGYPVSWLYDRQLCGECFYGRRGRRHMVWQAQAMEWHCPHCGAVVCVGGEQDA